MNIVQIYKKFPTHTTCVNYLENKRWGTNPYCPYCGSIHVARKHENQRVGRWNCHDCNRSYTVTVKTIFHNTHIDLQLWFLLASLMLNAKKGLSACQAARDLGIRRPTVWSMMHRIRKAMAHNDNLLQGIVEIDECYIGGKPRKGKKYDDPNDKPKRGRGTKKQPVIGMVERGGNAKAFMVSKCDLHAKPLGNLIRRNVDCSKTILITDEYTAYAAIGREMANHMTVNHSAGEFKRGIACTNEIEGLWATVKRAMVGQFHKVSAQYLPLYLDEITYRYNRRRIEQTDAFDELLALAVL